LRIVLNKGLRMYIYSFVYKRSGGLSYSTFWKSQ